MSRFRSIRWRIAIPYILLISVTMLGLGGYLTRVLRQNHLSNLQDTLESEARLLSNTLGQRWDQANEGDKMDTLAHDWADILGERVTIVAADGRVLGESHEDKSQMDNHANRPEIQQAFTTGEGSSIRFSDTVGYEMLYSAASVQVDGELIGAVRVAFPLQKIDDDQAQIQRTIWVFSIGAGTLAVLLALWIASRTTRSLGRLSEAASRMAEEDLRGRLQVESDDEVGQLARALDDMARRLNERMEALKAEQTKLFAVLSQMTDGVIIVDAEGVIVLVNSSAEDMFGIQEDKTLGNSLVRALGYYQLVDLWEQCRDLEEEQAILLEIPQVNKFFQAIATPLAGALTRHTLLLFQDLTRLRQVEKVRRDFVSNISHELRTPLASLKAIVETLHIGALDDPSAARHFLDQMENEIDALSQMVSELLELARIESGWVSLQLEAVNPYTLIANASERLRLQAEHAGIKLRVECPNDLPSVLADIARLEQVLANLIHNAIKFTPEGGDIAVSADTETEYVRFWVKDNGVGIPAESLARIFERFYKADQARQKGGTGLGLAIAKHLVEAHGGQIWAESVEGRGSIFYFTIPFSE